MDNVLVIGGTRFFGRHLVERLIERGARVTVLTRGNIADPFGGRVARLVADRCDRSSLAGAIAGRTWDIVYDQVLFSPNEAALACDLFAGKTGHYIMASSQSVYNPGKAISEAAFDPHSLTPQPGWESDFSYEDGKRFAEAVLFQRAVFPVSAIRWSLLVGTDDYTGRIWWHIDRVRRGMPIGLPNPAARVSFLRSDEAGRFAAWVGSRSMTGPINACANGTVSYGEIVALAERAVGRKAVIVSNANEADMSPIAGPDSWYMSNARAEAAGYHFSDMSEWMPGLMCDLAQTDYLVPRV